MRNLQSSMTATKMQLSATVVGVVFALAGIAGFIPGITTDYDSMKFAGHESGAMLLGVFKVSVLHNIVHLLFAVAGLLLARTWKTARLYLVVGGLIYAVLWLYGLAVDEHHQANFVPLNSADDWLHFGLAVLMIGLGAFFTRERGAIGRHVPTDAKLHDE